MAGVGTRLKHAWNAFRNINSTEDIDLYYSAPVSYGSRPDRTRYRISNERSIISAVYTRLGIDVAQVPIKHVRLDENGRYLSDIDSGINECLTVEANIDQAGRAFRQDVAMSLFDRGVIAIVPVDTTINPMESGSFDVKTLRVGDITAWFPQHVRVSVYNEAHSKREEVLLPKKFVAIVENPLYSVMNEQNSTLQRLIHKLNLLDLIDEKNSSGKLDLIIQLPYVIKSEARRHAAEQRRLDIEQQLSGSKYGIAYTDGTEKITQLNRPAENNLLQQVEYLTEMLYSQLGLTKEVMLGTADEKTMLNYYNRTVEPVLVAITEAMHRTFLTKTARTQGQAIHFIREPFRLVPINEIADIADKFTRNEILTSNEVRAIVGFKPAKDKNADKLVNSNMPAVPSNQPPQLTDGSEPSSLNRKENSQNGS